MSTYFFMSFPVDDLISRCPTGNVKSIRQLERTYTKIYRQNMSTLFNKICINEEMLLTHTHTHVRARIYIYIYESHSKNSEHQPCWKFLLWQHTTISYKARKTISDFYAERCSTNLKPGWDWELFDDHIYIYICVCVCVCVCVRV